MGDIDDGQVVSVPCSMCKEVLCFDNMPFGHAKGAEKSDKQLCRVCFKAYTAPIRTHTLRLLVPSRTCI